MIIGEPCQAHGLEARGLLWGVQGTTFERTPGLLFCTMLQLTRSVHRVCERGPGRAAHQFPRGPGDGQSLRVRLAIHFINDNVSLDAEAGQRPELHVCAFLPGQRAYNLMRWILQYEQHIPIQTRPCLFSFRILKGGVASLGGISWDTMSAQSASANYCTLAQERFTKLLGAFQMAGSHTASNSTTNNKICLWTSSSQRSTHR